jgi:hypothetical protein
VVAVVASVVVPVVLPVVVAVVAPVVVPVVVPVVFPVAPVSLLPASSVPGTSGSPTILAHAATTSGPKKANVRAKRRIV